MVQAGESADALTAARRALADRDADLADADRALAETVAGAHAIAAESIGRIEAINADIEAAAAADGKDSPAAAREMGRQLVAKSRETAGVLGAAAAAIEAKTVVLKRLAERYRP